MSRTVYTPVLREVTNWWSIQYHPRGHWCYFTRTFGNRRYRRWLVLKSDVEVSCHFTLWGASRVVREGVRADLVIMESLVADRKILVSPDGCLVYPVRAANE